ncbi:hypothetical protein TREMEDRAFT_70789 [Tremella mesenterica DSM 1558]|uniref:uncharacterized protein n=1 Tax=Tremella mesenterica (strain ATCC 24925 / CBS 8224 / DSM 1558 / NBRC 9311 / NRRL Y-6157 / RJB 2259-6 / UBC 559-6) TaxID=578456 RepID=UPI0003F49969|nr:uncharacterized protein TREMEDRAFT_70789 [Tremella mesenterica DSM 1558]EIW72690.1 hypothetical protein TREMEDRAFT_70789 [Tremella mesenterica DSM 1558]
MQPPGNTLSSLLAQANSLNDTDMDTELPQIRLGLDEIERMSESVAGRGKKVKQNNGQGHTLLSNLGINTSQLSRSIAQLPSAHQTALTKRRRRPHVSRLQPLGDLGPGYAMPDGDIAAWGRNWHEMTILSGIEYQRQKTVKLFQQQFQQRILQNWEAEKARILQEELGVTDDELARLSGVNVSSPALGASSLGKSALGASTRRFPMAQSTYGKGSVESKEGGLVMHSKMMKYERVISELNQRRSRKDPFELCQALEASVKDDSKHPMLSTAFRLLAHMTYEPSLRDPSAFSENTSRAEQVQERQYAAAYLGEPRSSHAALLRGRLVQGARKFLERDFEHHVEETIAKYPKEAALGGIPGIRNKIRAFVQVTLKNKETQDSYKAELVDGIYLWAQAYYLLRCGYYDDALDLIAEHSSSVGREDWSFPGCFNTFLHSSDKRLPKSQKDQLYNDFNAHVRNNPNVDQYKYALYKIVGRFELGRKSLKVAATTEDWMWLQLSLVRESRENEPPQDHYDQNELSKLLLRYGNDKFDANGARPFAWFNLLLLTGQFERAVAYLYSKPSLRTDAVHFAIALQYYGLLRVPAASDEVDLCAITIRHTIDRDICYINFARLIKNYISPFFKVEPQTALQYAYLVALASDAPNGVGEKQKQYTLELVRDIVLASRAWTKLLGSVRADGSKETGAIERDLHLLKLNDEADYLRQVVLSAADQSALDASLADSIELYHLAGAYDKVVETVNRALGHSLGQASQPVKAGSELGLTSAFGGAQDLYSLAQKVWQVYEKDFGKRTRVSKAHWETLSVLLRLKLGLAQFAADRPDLALETLRSTNLLPLDNDPSSIPRYAQRFKEILDQPSISNLDDVVVTAMKCLHRLSQQLKQSPYGDHTRMAQINDLKYQAQCLIQFASTLRLRLGPDVYRQLSSMSAFF